ncbi:hypothetical protein Dip510_001937 [Elusimicrobium posterum]|uniref:HK97 gp10 family phage protein n=1 Tax=Elusimicrobium posterum TaxID=3116653 RepID=UPI003C777177
MFEFETSGFGDNLAQKLEGLKEKIINGKDSVAEKVSRELKDQLIAAAPQKSGNLKSSITTAAEKDSFVTGDLDNTAYYAVYLEEKQPFISPVFDKYKKVFTQKIKEFLGGIK